MKIKNSRQHQSGEAHMAVILAGLVIVGIFAIGYTVSEHQPDEKAGQATVARDDSARPATTPEPESEIQWQFSQEELAWQAMGGTPPKCPDKVLKTSPVEVSKASSVLLPGQYRGVHYKAHGGFRFDNSANNVYVVKLPLDARLVGLVRYYQIGLQSGKQELQYLLTFENSCGIQVRFDHLAVLTDQFATIAETTPEPKLDDTRSMPLPEQPSFKAGTVVATSIGSPDGSNTSMDFGVYDLRKANEISGNAAWADLHRNEASQNFFGVCWLNWLPSADASKAKTLMSKAPANDKGASDYCTTAPGGGTLQYNGGRPL